MGPDVAEVDCLSGAVEIWILQAVVCARFLAGLYRGMDDGKQAYIALLAAQDVTERMERMGRLESRYAELQAAFERNHSGDVEAEEAAWRGFLAAQAGLWSLVALLEWMGHSMKGLRGQRTATRKAFCRALAGYRSAFPDELARQGLFRALDEAGRRCLECLATELAEAPEEERREAMKEARVMIQGSLQNLVAGAFATDGQG